MIPRRSGRERVVFLLDVDNTLLDNDRVVDDFRAVLTREFGPERATRYWTIFEEHRRELGYADYLGALQRFRLEDPHDPHLLAISSMLVNYPFQARLFPGAIDVIRHLAQWGSTVILSDGDVVFQPLKIERSGLGAAVEGACSFTCTRSASSPTSKRGTRLTRTFWWTTRSAFSPM